MNSFKKILCPKIQKFIADNLNINLSQFLLRKSPFEEVSVQEIAQQIKGRQIAQKKFPFLLKEGIIFPPHINLEQASSQDTAQAKSTSLKGNRFLDITCGLGIDAYFLSQNFTEVTLIEQNSLLMEMVKHNWETLSRKAIFINDDLEVFLKNNQKKFDLIYADPARRDTQNNKKFLLEDLSPNIIKIQHQLLDISEKVMIKLSPLIDIKALQNQIKHIEKIEIIAVKNEVKEIILFLGSGFEGKTKIIARNLNSQEPDFSFFTEEESSAVSEYSDPLKYIYIPNNSILKSGAFNLISKRFDLKKLHPNTHIYTSNDRIDNFCGRVFEITEISSKAIKKGEQFNIISKNYPLSPEAIKSKYKLKDGGENYLLFTQAPKGKVILMSKKNH